jgi:hypothetical protein
VRRFKVMQRTKTFDWLNDPGVDHDCVVDFIRQVTANKALPAIREELFSWLRRSHLMSEMCSLLWMRSTHRRVCAFLCE